MQGKQKISREHFVVSESKYIQKCTKPGHIKNIQNPTEKNSQWTKPGTMWATK